MLGIQQPADLFEWPADGAGFIAGAVNSVAGGGSLISFPALLGVGLSPLAANVTNTIGLLPGYFGGALAYRGELETQRRRAAGLSLTAVAGAAAGAAILLETPGSAFERVVPGLLIAACVLLVIQPRLAQFVAGRSGSGPRSATGLHVVTFLGAIYGGYFGAALGVLLLALFGVLLPEGLQRANALKIWLSLVIAIVGSVIFATFGPVLWADGGVLAGVGSVGGHLGGRFGLAAGGL